jgi:hypothetical protein
MKLKIFISIVAIVILSGCSTLTPEQRFPNFAKQVGTVKSIDVVVDATVLSDIDGDNIGFNLKKNQIAREQVATSIRSEFNKKGIEANIIFASSGLFIEPSKEESETKFVLSDDWKETGEVFVEPVASNSESVWLTEKGKKLLKKISSRGLVENKSEKSDKAEKRYKEKVASTPKVTAADIPESVSLLSSDLLAVIRYSANEVSTGKSVGAGIATGILTAVLTGGMYVSVSMPVSSMNIDATLFDLSKSDVVWSNNLYLQGAQVDTEVVSPNVVTLLGPLPSAIADTALEQTDLEANR